MRKIGIEYLGHLTDTALGQMCPERPYYLADTFLGFAVLGINP